MSWQRIYVDGRWQSRFVPTQTVQLPVFRFAEQRAQCQGCAHAHLETSAGDGYAIALLRCDLTHHLPCSFSRLQDGPCGPDGRHFTPRRST